MQDKKLIISLFFAVLVLSATVTPSIAFIYPDGSQDDYFENFGPRIDQILIKKYAGLQPEIDALKAGEIDFTDWSLTRSQIDDLSGDPNIAVVDYGGEGGYYTLNFNNNPNQYLGNPPNPLYPNPVYATNPCVVKEFRQACSYLLDRVALCAGPGQGMYKPVFTPIPAYMQHWIHPDISYTGSRSDLAYPPSVAAASSKLDEGGFPLGGPNGYRYWDKNRNGVYNPANENLTVIFYTRTDALRKGAADALIAGFGNPAIKVDVTAIAGGGGVANQKCMDEKNYHMYTVGWIYIGPDPDYLYDLYHWDNYWHPTEPPNFGAISQYDTVMQDALEGMKYAPDALSAQSATYAFQERFAEVAAECPLGSMSAPKAYSKWYTGGNDGVAKGDAEDKYRGQLWNQIVNEKGQGENSYYTFLNAYPGTYQYGDGNMTARYGWCDNSMPLTLNPMYSSWYWESEAWGKCFDGLGGRDPMTKLEVNVPALAENWTLGTWVDPYTSKTLSKVTVTIRPDVLWTDGKPLVIDDVIYTLFELPKELLAKHCPDVWWQPTLDRIVGCCRLDRYTVEIFLDVKSFLAVNWIIGNVIIPKHIWHPYIATHTVAQITGNMANSPEMLVGTGPFMFVSNTAETLLLTRNPNYYQIMDTSASRFEHFATSMKKGITVEAIAPTVQLSPCKIKATPPVGVKITVPVTNLDVNDAQDINMTVELVYPNRTVAELVHVHNLVLDPLEIDNEIFTVGNLSIGIYTIRVTIAVASGDLYDWVHANLDPSLWGMILGPRTIEKKFWVTVLADINEDWVVDIFDMVIVSSHFGAYYSEPLYSSRADVNHDFMIDIFDIVLVAIVFGWE